MHQFKSVSRCAPTFVISVFIAPLLFLGSPAMVWARVKLITLPVRELRPYTGAGWIVAVCGDMQTMPGLPAEPAAFRIDVDGDGRTVGLR